MKDIKVVINTVVASILALGTLTATGASSAADAQDMEKCYGIAKAGKNDCATGSAGCAGSSKKDSQGDSFLLLPKGTCEKIVGASKEPKK